MFIGKKLIAYGIGIIWILGACAVAADDSPPSVAVQKRKFDEMKFPQIAEVTGTDVYIRSGAGTSYYFCGKLSKPAKVTVLGVLYSTWAKIVPPEGSYSWISRTYVNLDPQNKGFGVVKQLKEGTGVAVWAGSDFMPPLHSSTQQVKLYTGDIVELVGEQDDNIDYYRIKPPPGAFLWISVDYLKFLGPVKLTDKKVPDRPQKPVKEPKKDDKPKEQPKVDLKVDTPKPPVKPGEKTVETVKPPVVTVKPADVPVEKVVVPDKTVPEKPVEKVIKPAEDVNTVEPEKTVQPEISQLTPQQVEQMALGKCQQISELIEKEKNQKPLPQQDYTELKTVLEKMLNTPNIGRAKTYAQILIERIQRYELAQQVQKEMAAQDKKLQEAISKIEKAKEAQYRILIPLEAKYLFIGNVKTSNIYTGNIGPRRYLVTNQAGKILCYAIGENALMNRKLEKAVGRIAGINGTVMSDPGALITTVMVRNLDYLDVPEEELKKLQK